MSAVISTPFDSAEEALSYAFAMEAKRLQPTLSVEQIIKSTNPLHLSMEERIADGIIIKNVALSHLGVKARALIYAEFTVPVDKSLDARKQAAIQALRGFIYQNKADVGSKYFVEDVIREWTGERPHNDLKRWSTHLSIPYSTLHRRARGRNGNNKSITEYLNIWRDTAMTLVRVSLSEKGLIE